MHSAPLPARNQRIRAVGTDTKDPETHGPWVIICYARWSKNDLQIAPKQDATSIPITLRQHER